MHTRITNYQALDELILRAFPEVTYQAAIFLQRALLITKGRHLDAGASTICRWLGDRVEPNHARRMRRQLVELGHLIPIHQRKRDNGALSNTVFGFGEALLSVFTRWQQSRFPVDNTQNQAPEASTPPGQNGPTSPIEKIDEIGGGRTKMAPQENPRIEDSFLTSKQGGLGRAEALPPKPVNDDQRNERQQWLAEHGYSISRPGSVQTRIMDPEAYKAELAARKWQALVEGLSNFVLEYFAGEHFKAVEAVVLRAMAVDNGKELSRPDHKAINKLVDIRKTAIANGWKSQWRKAG